MGIVIYSHFYHQIRMGCQCKKDETKKSGEKNEMFIHKISPLIQDDEH